MIEDTLLVLLKLLLRHMSLLSIKKCPRRISGCSRIRLVLSSRSRNARIQSGGCRVERSVILIGQLSVCYVLCNSGSRSAKAKWSKKMLNEVRLEKEEKNKLVKIIRKKSEITFAVCKTFPSYPNNLSHLEQEDRYLCCWFLRTFCKR
jgi:hypothetical protein